MLKRSPDSDLPGITKIIGILGEGAVAGHIFYFLLSGCWSVPYILLQCSCTAISQIHSLWKCICARSENISSPTCLVGEQLDCDLVKSVIH